MTQQGTHFTKEISIIILIWSKFHASMEMLMEFDCCQILHITQANKSNVECQKTLGCLDQYIQSGLRPKHSGLWSGLGIQLCA